MGKSLITKTFMALSMAGALASNVAIADIEPNQAPTSTDDTELIAAENENQTIQTKLEEKIEAFHQSTNYNSCSDVINVISEAALENQVSINQIYETIGYNNTYFIDKYMEIATDKAEQLNERYTSLINGNSSNEPIDTVTGIKEFDKKYSFLKKQEQILVEMGEIIGNVIGLSIDNIDEIDEKTVDKLINAMDKWNPSMMMDALQKINPQVNYNSERISMSAGFQLNNLMNQARNIKIELLLMDTIKSMLEQNISPSQANDIVNQTVTQGIIKERNRRDTESSIGDIDNKTADESTTYGFETTANEERYILSIISSEYEKYYCLKQSNIQQGTAEISPTITP